MALGPLHAADNGADTAAALVEQAVRLLPGAIAASLTVPLRGRFATWAATSEAARRADALQFELGEGPCLRGRDAPIWSRSDDLGAEDRWPRWGAAVTGLGFESLLSVPVQVRRHQPVALTLWSTEPGAFADDAIVDLALLFAEQAAPALDAAHTVDGLRTALRTRHEIGVAQGILMHRYDLDLEGAFELLRRTSSHANVKLVTLAEQVIAHGDLPSAPGVTASGAAGDR